MTAAALPEDPPWWYLFDVTEQELLIVAKEIQLLYHMDKVRKNFEST